MTFSQNYTFPGEQDSLDRLGELLAAKAGSEGLLEVAYRVIDSPVGSLLLAATEAGVVRVAFEREDHDTVLEQLSDNVSPRILKAPARLDETARELEDYFAGDRHDFEVPLDTRLSAGFRREVLSHLREISYGHTASYASVAALTSSPKAVRAVGTACARNPLPLLLPCHRVVRSDGSSGAYLGGAEAKKYLLAMEASRS